MTELSDAQQKELFELYHLSATALAGMRPTRHARMVWAAREFEKLHPEISSTRAYKELDRANAWRNI